MKPNEEVDKKMRPGGVRNAYLSFLARLVLKGLRNSSARMKEQTATHRILQ